MENDRIIFDSQDILPNTPFNNMSGHVYKVMKESKSLEAPKASETSGNLKSLKYDALDFDLDEFFDDF